MKLKIACAGVVLLAAAGLAEAATGRAELLTFSGEVGYGTCPASLNTPAQGKAREIPVTARVNLELGSEQNACSDEALGPALEFQPEPVTLLQSADARDRGVVIISYQ